MKAIEERKAILVVFTPMALIFVNQGNPFARYQRVFFKTFEATLILTKKRNGVKHRFSYASSWA